MKKLIHTIIIAAAAAVAVHAALMISAADFDGCAEPPALSGPCDGGSCNILKDSDAGGLFAYNALKGTAEHISSSDRRQVPAFRNSYNGVSCYNQATSKRHFSPGLKWSLEGGTNRLFTERYCFLQHNPDILDHGMSSNSERIHFLRVLII